MSVCLKLLKCLSRLEPDRRYFGVVSLYNCTFENCRFERIGFLAPREFVENAQSGGFVRELVSFGIAPPL
jgi:hypothetical protein